MGSNFRVLDLSIDDKNPTSKIPAYNPIKCDCSAELGSSVYVVNLENGGVRRAAAPPIFAFHHVNAYEDDRRDVIVLDVCTVDPANLGRKLSSKTKV